LICPRSRLRLGAFIELRAMTTVQIPDIEELKLNYHEFRIAMHLYRRRQDGILGGSPREIASHCRVSLGTTREVLAALVARDLAQVSKISGEDAAALLCKKAPGRFPSRALVSCSWCRYSGPVMHQHHYPVSAAAGGNETIPICPSCHSEFHAITDSPIYEASDLLGAL
jgi:hypothetical protein